MSRTADRLQTVAKRKKLLAKARFKKALHQRFNR
ncbi:hypothetical protein OA78_1775 [Latilactobacillus curvatus]|nr:hypothetical protein OA78_1775 [Latilactobacillus curvatus]